MNNAKLLALLVAVAACGDDAPTGTGVECAAGTTLVGDEGDRRAHLHLMELLAAERPDDAVLSEEGRDDLARLDVDRVWIVDPLDGTREFSEPGRSDWAVHVALVVSIDPDRPAGDPATEAFLRQQVHPRWQTEAFSAWLDSLAAEHTVRIASEGVTPADGPAP